MLDVPEDYDVLDAIASGGRLRFKRDTVLAYQSRRNVGGIPRTNRRLIMGLIWYKRCIKEREVGEDQAHGE